MFLVIVQKPKTLTRTPYVDFWRNYWCKHYGVMYWMPEKKYSRRIEEDARSFHHQSMRISFPRASLVFFRRSSSTPFLKLVTTPSWVTSAGRNTVRDLLRNERSCR